MQTGFWPMSDLTIELGRKGTRKQWRWLAARHLHRHSPLLSAKWPLIEGVEASLGLPRELLLRHKP